jgi:hypothetical protein
MFSIILKKIYKITLAIFCVIIFFANNIKMDDSIKIVDNKQKKILENNLLL